MGAISELMIFWDYVMWISPSTESNYSVNTSFMSIIDHEEYKGTGDKIYDEVYKSLYIFIDMYSRNSSYGQNKYNSKSVHDMLNIFNRLVDYYSFHLTINNIELMIFPRAPHAGHDFLLYKVAKALNIETLIFEQSIFPNKFFYYFDNEDYGFFNTSKAISIAKPIRIKKCFEKDFFYMKKKLDQNTIRSFMDYLNIKKYINFIRKKLLSYSCIRLISELTNSEGRDQALYRFNIDKNYSKYLYEITKTDFSYDKKYVYFGLHLQPEKTTSNWGGIFNDQVLALERLSKIIPDDWLIYVKENPKQTGFMRGKWFFERLKALKNIVVVPIETSTYDLLENCQFASTITGSIGWEAITGGKNVLVFGWGVWYKTLPGVFSYDENFKFEDILKYKINHSELETKLGFLFSKMANGVVYYNYELIVEDFTKEQNANLIIEAIKTILMYNNNSN